MNRSMRNKKKTNVSESNMRTVNDKLETKEMRRKSLDSINNNKSDVNVQKRNNVKPSIVVASKSPKMSKVDGRDGKLLLNKRKNSLSKESSTIDHPIISDEPKKVERSNSFFLTRKLSKIYHTLTGSKDNLTKINEKAEDEHPFKFTRSLSMVSIPLRKSYRKVVHQSKLEQLCEESVTISDKTIKEVDEKKDDIAAKVVVDECCTNISKPGKLVRKNSNILLTLKQTFSNQLEKKRPLNPRWSASLASLQQVDMMVSYEDLSFINYDKFNTYEKNLERTMSQQNLSRHLTIRQSVNEKILTNQIQKFEAINPPEFLRQNSSECDIANPKASDLIIRRPRRRRKENIFSGPKIPMPDSGWNLNFDQSKNVYRQSLDDEQLKFLNKVNRESFRLSEQFTGDHATLKLSDQVLTDHDHRSSYEHGQLLTSVGEDRIDGNENFSKCGYKMCVNKVTPLAYRVRFLSVPNVSNGEKCSVYRLKSKSLTHLDALESHSTHLDLPSSKPKADYLEVQNSTNTICCLTTSQSSSNQSIKKNSPSLKSNKRPILTRSNVSSAEYVRVCYDTENGFGEKEEEFIPAIKGTTLGQALYDGLSRRNLSFSQITISDNNFQCSVDLGTPPYSGGFNQNTDVSNLAGKCLIVTEKEQSGGVSGGINITSNNIITTGTGTMKKSGHCSLQKAASFGARQRPAKLFQSASTEETTIDASESKQSQSSASSKQPTKQRWSVLFGLKNPQQNQLCETLNQYARNGVPQPQSSYTFEHIDLPPALEYLHSIHSSWMEFVCHPDMTDNEIKIQTAIWELVTTEVDYIHALKTVTDLFLACLEGIQGEHILNEIDQHKLFANIRDICEANIKFWTMYIYPMVRHSINTGHPMCVDYFQQGFVTFATTFAPYKKYCAEQSTCQFYCKELQRNNPLFQAYLAWCEAQKLCNRLRLADILVRPMQRLTKYNLLLSAIKKHITDENDAEIMDAMIHSVENFVCSVNSHLTTRQENERLKGIMARIESYDVVDSNNEHLDKIAKQYSTMFDLCGPMRGCSATQGRHLFMEGDLKFKDIINKVDVHCFLLTDVLLVCKPIAKKGLGTLKVIRQPFLTDRLVIKVKENTLYSVYLNEYNVAVTAFTLQCPEAKSWHDAIAKAKHIYSRLKQGTSWDGYNIKHGNSNEMLGVKKSPLNSSIGSKVSSLNNSHSGSVELTESKTVSIDNEKTNSLSSDEGLTMGVLPKKVPQNSPTKFKAISSNTLVVQPLLSLGQSLPNLNLNTSQTINNTLLVPGAVSTSGHSNLLSPSHRGISYPPPSPTRATLRRGFAFSSSIKNPPLVKSRNITSQNSFNITFATAASSSSSFGQSSGVGGSSGIGTNQQQIIQHQQQQTPTTRDSNIQESDV